MKSTTLSVAVGAAVAALVMPVDGLASARSPTVEDLSAQMAAMQAQMTAMQAELKELEAHGVRRRSERQGNGTADER